MVLDFGTGTGVLAILAKKLGAAKITAIDNDDWSIRNAKENFSANDCDDINLFKTDTLTDPGGLNKFDIILANINLHVISSNLCQLKQVSSRSSQLLLSGFLKTDEDQLIKNFTLAGFKLTDVKRKGEWSSILFTNCE